MREGTSRVTVADRPCGGFYDFYSVSLEEFEYHLVSYEKSKIVFFKPTKHTSTG